MPIPAQPKIYHILHVDRLPSVLSAGNLFCDAKMNGRSGCGTAIGMSGIKQRRLTLPLHSQKGLYVGECVPFYFCPRSVMLYLLYRSNHRELTYRGGQDAIVHLEADLHNAVNWAQREGLRWAFTLSNAGAFYFEDRCDLAQIGEINWEAVASTNFRNQAVQEGKQAEFLLEGRFPWTLVDRIGVHSQRVAQQVANVLGGAQHRPQVAILSDWYY